MEFQKLYNQFYPTDCKYISLFPPEDGKELKGKSAQRRKEIMNKIRELHENGTLVEGFSWRLESASLLDEEDEAAEEDPEKDDFFE